MKKLLTLIFLFIFVAACTSSPQVSKTPDQVKGLPTAGYPPPVSAPSNESGYPAPQEFIESTSAPTPTQDPTLGQVRGKFIITEPVFSSYVLYLAEVVKDDQGTEFVVSFIRELSYPAVPDENGSFVFVNVPPGRYGLVFDQISISYLMSWPGKEDSLLVTVEPGKTIDLGTLEYEAPPSQ